MKVLSAMLLAFCVSTSVNAQHASLELCTFSPNGERALVSEMQDIFFRERLTPLYGLYALGQNSTFDSLTILNDSVYFVKSSFDSNGMYQLMMLKQFSLNDFIAQHRLSVPGMDLTKEIEIHLIRSLSEASHGL